MLAKIRKGIGVLFVTLGLASADSPCLWVPLALLIVGALLIGRVDYVSK